MAVLRIVSAIVNEEHSVLPVSGVVQGQYGLEGLCLSLPALVGREGIEEILEIPLDKREEEALRRSAGYLRRLRYAICVKLEKPGDPFWKNEMDLPVFSCYFFS